MKPILLMAAVLLVLGSQTPTYVVDRPAVSIDGPWRFQTGDDPGWAARDFDDSGWGTLDLEPEEGAHDGDVGLTSYVPGWTSNGYAGYSGFAWYRTRVSVVAKDGVDLAMLAPPYVDDVYQLFWNGALIGQSGDFSGPVPVVYSTKPQVLTPPPGETGEDVVLAVRVWMGPATAKEADSGGIHIAPAIGERRAIEARYQVQWGETFRGYVVDVVEPLLFVLLVLLAWCLVRIEGRKTFHGWLAVALLLMAAVRVNQAVYFWLSVESLDAFIFAKYCVLLPLGLGAWAMTWRSWFCPDEMRWLPRAVLVIVALMMAAWFGGDALEPAVQVLRIAMLAVLVAIAYVGVRRREPDWWLALVAMLLLAIGQFAGEVSTLGVPGIWFPFGTGVSRTQYVYAVLVLVLAALLIRRHFRKADDVIVASPVTA